jgi:NADH-quinone oxidoreductase subunit M
MHNIPNLLSIITFLPLVGAIVIATIRGDDANVARNARWVALWTSSIVFVLSLLLWFGFDRANPGFQFEERAEWIPSLNIAYRMGVDGISMPFVILSTLLTPICILASWEAIELRVKEYMIAFLALETLMIGTFCALDFVAFYVFFEGVLIPMFIIIGVWGGPRRVYSAFKFFLYTLLGSVLMLVAILTMYDIAGTTDIPTLMTQSFDPSLQIWLWLALFASFAVKVPMWPVHTWLPDAHVEAPTAGSVILAGVLLKMGGYGFLRFSIPMLPDASMTLAPLVFALSIIAVVYTSLVALAQSDMKKLIAYSSVAHMGFVTAGTFTFNRQGVEGAIFQMLSHGVVSGALFLCVGVVYDRLHSREIARYGGLVNNMPRYAFAFMIFTMASVGLPGTGGFIGEFLVMAGAFQASTWLAFFITTGIILGAAYMLWLYRRVIFGKLEKDDVKAMLDLSPREIAIFAPLILIVLWMGIYPASFTSITGPAVEQLLANYHTATNTQPVQPVIAPGAAAPATEMPAEGTETPAEGAEPAGEGQ